jgi:transcriptional regulator with XRE-family HTH domain
LSKSVYSAHYKRLRALLIAYREKAGLTQTELAKALGRPQSFISKVESGERRLDVVELLEVLRALNYDSAEFISELSRKR